MMFLHQRKTACVILWIVLAWAPRAFAGPESDPALVAKGVLLVASPSLNDPNFRETVVLVLEHRPQGTLGLVINRPTGLLLSEALPELAALKGTNHRLFAGGPVQPTVMLLLSRLKMPEPDMRVVFDSVYVGGTPEVLERLIEKAVPADRFRAFAGYAGWAPGQLDVEMRQGAWAVLSAESSLFDQNPETFWRDCLSRLEAPRVISNE
jgi:putative transcriptional regulator